MLGSPAIGLIVVFLKQDRCILLLEVSCPADVNMMEKEKEKVGKHRALAGSVSPVEGWKALGSVSPVECDPAPEIFAEATKGLRHSYSCYLTYIVSMI